MSSRFPNSLKIQHGCQSYPTTATTNSLGYIINYSELTRTELLQTFQNKLFLTLIFAIMTNNYAYNSNEGHMVTKNNEKSKSGPPYHSSWFSWIYYIYPMIQAFISEKYNTMQSRHNARWPPNVIVGFSFTAVDISKISLEGSWKINFSLFSSYFVTTHTK